MYSGYPVIAMGQLKRLHWGRPGMFGKLDSYCDSTLHTPRRYSRDFWLLPDYFFWGGRLGFSSESVSKEQRGDFGKNAIYEF